MIPVDHVGHDAIAITARQGDHRGQGHGVKELGCIGIVGQRYAILLDTIAQDGPADRILAPLRHGRFSLQRNKAAVAIHLPVMLRNQIATGGAHLDAVSARLHMPAIHDR